MQRKRVQFYKKSEQGFVQQLDEKHSLSCNGIIWWELEHNFKIFKMLIIKLEAFLNKQKSSQNKTKVSKQTLVRDVTILNSQQKALYMNCGDAFLLG